MVSSTICRHQHDGALMRCRMVTQATLKAVFCYNPTTGIFTRLNPVGKQKREYTRVDNEGYVKIHINGIPYRAHRLAWLYMTGFLPKQQIDHIDGNRSNNKWPNLRDVPHIVNVQNRRKAQRNNKSTGLIGVSLMGNKYLARIGFGGRRIRIGLFPTEEEAYEAYLEYKRRLHIGCTI